MRGGMIGGVGGTGGNRIPDNKPSIPSHPYPGYKSVGFFLAKKFPFFLACDRHQHATSGMKKLFCRAILVVAGRNSEIRLP
ncbi:hypothetical protein TNCV_908991 [Trichonephila clavipes]|nr:hypothetical protein TNCV_908991 [Trichonephila clavipes]